ncbi:hypothetical protein [Zhihengliuella flava]|uniref:Uncharacterized protein n=1 Tax=Zhihengliuella flava TaxID=1285193 RepID=A0A931GD98_9MICC|nr:hypothetical protein [Zhihengliuella flava]MBG6083268.1 hypothetical protein [Zhihengliuella flava]
MSTCKRGHEITGRNARPNGPIPNCRACTSARQKLVKRGQPVTEEIVQAEADLYFEIYQAGFNNHRDYKVAALIEDAEFLAIHGETANGAAERLGLKKAGYLYTQLTRHGRVDIYQRLAANSHAQGIAA